MISNHLSMIEELRPASDELAAQIAEFVAAGGEIDVVEPPPPPKPVVYVPQEPPTPKPFVRRRVEAAPMSLDAGDLRDQTRAKMIDRMRQLSPTHTQTETAALLGVSRQVIQKHASRNDITFKKPERGGASGRHPKNVMDARDAKLAERIKACLELGVSRRQCCGRLAISNKTLERVLAGHGIDYPKARQVKVDSCAA